MTPQDKMHLTPITEKEVEQLQEPDGFAALLDDEPFELPPSYPDEAIALLRFWREDESDTEEQEETFEFLRRVLDEDRFTTRKLFP